MSPSTFRRVVPSVALISLSWVLFPLVGGAYVVPLPLSSGPGLLLAASYLVLFGLSITLLAYPAQPASISPVVTMVGTLLIWSAVGSGNRLLWPDQDWVSLALAASLSLAGIALTVVLVWASRPIDTGVWGWTWLSSAERFLSSRWGWLALIGLVLYGVVLLRVAWLSDDAYITLRTVDNFVYGRGLIWNPGERVQAYTHPLWMLALSAAVFFTREVYYTTLALSYGLSLAAVAVMVFGLAHRRNAALVIALLVLSQAFMDYSTSGLENPLAHILMACFLMIYAKSVDAGTKPERFIPIRQVALLALIAGLATLNRMDHVLLYAPALLYTWWQAEDRLAAGVAIAAGFLPLAAWMGFSIYYYGFPFPNTAYAKLTTHIPDWRLALQGLQLFRESLKADPLTTGAVVLGVLLPWLGRRARLVPLALGILVYCLYIVRIGGDFMAGRFLSTPFIIAVGIIAVWGRFASPSKGITPLTHTGDMPCAQVLWAILCIGLIAPPVPTLASGAAFARRYPPPLIDRAGIANERASFYECTGLLVIAWQQRSDCIDPDAPVNRQVDYATEDVVGGIGRWGYFAGPDAYVIDYHALSDAFLARLPPVKDAWRPGHLRRDLPAGYRDTVRGTENVIEDPALRLYYDRIRLIIRGPLNDPERLRTIWKLNLGHYDPLLAHLAGESAHLGLLARLTGARIDSKIADAVVSARVPPTGRMADDYRTLADLLAMSPTDGPVLVFPSAQADALVGSAAPVIPLSITSYPLTIGEAAAALQRADTLDSESLHVVLVDEAASDPDRTILLALESRHYRIAENWVGLLHHIHYASGPPDPDTQVIEAILEGGLALETAAVIDSETVPGGFIRIALTWRAASPVLESYKVFVHVFDADDTLRAQRDAVPGNDLFPTPGWVPEQPVIDRFAISLPDDLAPGRYRIVAGLYHPVSGIRLPIQSGPDSGGDSVPIGEVEVLP